jgi:cephalosporin hydroxylase
MSDSLVTRWPQAQAALETCYYPPHGTPWPPLRYRGVPCQQIAPDLWALGELVRTLQPAVMVETGTAAGGTALYLADQLALGRHDGVVLTMDLGPRPAALAGRDDLGYCCGASTVPAVVAFIRAAVGSRGGPVLVTLDSSHDAATVAAELAVYAPLVTGGSYLVVQDTNLGASVMPAHGPGPAVALAAYLAAHPGEWVVDLDVQPPITCHPGGWLRRVAP